MKKNEIVIIMHKSKQFLNKYLSSVRGKAMTSRVKVQPLIATLPYQQYKRTDYYPLEIPQQ